MGISILDDPRLLAARRAVALASKVTRAVQADLECSGAREKEDRSPVTIADYAAQAVVAHVLEADLGPVCLVAEEEADELRSPEQAGLLARCVDRVAPVWPEVTPEDFLRAVASGGQAPRREGFWTLDPVDGTKGFLRNQHYAVCLAWVQEGEVELGVLACPNLSHCLDVDPAQIGAGVLAVAKRGQGAWLGRLAKDAELKRVDPTPLTTDAVRVCESVEHRHSNFDANREILEAAGLDGIAIRIDSQVKYAVVARGSADLYLRLPAQRGYVEKIWDHAAGSLLAEEAGLLVTDVAGRRLDFGHGRRLEANQGVVVARPVHHPRLMAAIRNLGFVAERS